MIPGYWLWLQHTDLLQAIDEGLINTHTFILKQSKTNIMYVQKLIIILEIFPEYILMPPLHRLRR